MRRLSSAAMSNTEFTFVDLTPRMTEPAVAAVWSLAAFDPQDLEHRKRVLSFYPPLGTRRLFGMVNGDIVAATCGASEHADGRVTVHQMATVPALRKQGLGRRLLAAVIEKLDPRI